MHLKFYFECKFTTHLCNQSAHLPKKNSNFYYFSCELLPSLKRLPFLLGLVGGFCNFVGKFGILIETQIWKDDGEDRFFAWFFCFGELRYGGGFARGF